MITALEVFGIRKMLMEILFRYKLGRILFSLLCIAAIAEAVTRWHENKLRSAVFIALSTWGFITAITWKSEGKNGDKSNEGGLP